MKVQKKIWIVSGVAVILLTAAYLAMAMFYTEGFTFGTFINGIYCTGKSVEQVNAELIAQSEYTPLTIHYLHGKKETITVDDRMISLDYTESLGQLANHQNPYMWYQNVVPLSGNELFQNHDMKPEILVNETYAEEMFHKLVFMQVEEKREKKLSLNWNRAEGYYLINGKENVLDIEKAKICYLKALEQGLSELDLVAEGCYYDAELLPEEQKQQALYESIQGFLNFELSYQMGKDRIVFDKAALGDLLATDENRFDFIYDDFGRFTWDEEKIEAVIETIAAEYDTYGKPHTFIATSGEKIILDKGTYGNELNQVKEKAYLKDALENHVSEVHEPEYKRKAWCQGKDDIGDTYIEVDMGAQKLHFYKEGTLIVETDIVTGDMRRRRSTPEGVYFIYLKQKNRVLRGPGYASPVKFWMPVKGGVGIHDANWRDEFGGNIYETDGSHGCINIPPDIMEDIYEQAEVGMPVVMFY